MLFDNSSSKFKGMRHVSIPLEAKDVSIAYCHIRKCGCTSIKKFIRGEVSTSLKWLEYAAHNKLTKQEASKHDFRIFIYRNPIERFVSGFVNKFVQQSGNDAVFESVKSILSKDPVMCTLNEFIEQYLTLLLVDKTMVDQHFHPIAWHLYPISYTHAIELKKMRLGMASIIGEDLAHKYFSIPHNKSSIISNAYSSVSNISDLSNMPAFELSKSKLYSKIALLESLSVDHLQLLKDIYCDDFKLFSRLSQN